MVQQSSRWSAGKILVCTVACGVATPVLFWLAAIAENAAKKNMSEDAQNAGQIIPLPTFIQILGICGMILTVLGIFWLAVRYRESRIPVWERGKKRKRR